MGVCHTSTVDHQHELAAVKQGAPFVLPETAFHRINCTKDQDDHRDLVFDHSQHSKVKHAAPPAAVDLRPSESFPIYNQGRIGSCTANALAAAFHFEQLRQGINGFSPSRLFVYYNERVLEGKTSRDTGASLRDGIKVLHKLGVCDESMWPYEAWRMAQRPREECYKAAQANRCLKYARVEQNLDALRACLAAGYPFVFGFQIFCDFIVGDVSATGVMTIPPRGHSHGGHAVQACGYDDERRVFIVRNSWGEDWGDRGHFYMPYDFIVHPQLCFDFWVIHFVEGGDFPAVDKATAAANAKAKNKQKTAAQATSRRAGSGGA